MAGKPILTVDKIKPASVKSFSCPVCGAPIAIRALGMSLSVACSSCGSVIDPTNENYQVLEVAARKTQQRPLIPLGQRGKLHGVTWECIGFMIRSDASAVYFWREYLLFNPIKGFRWLMEFDGHWSYIVQTKDNPVMGTHGNHNVAVSLGTTYHLFHRGRAITQYVIGEFYWQVKVGETVIVEDYISPPEILSCEKSDNEVVWSIGQYVSPGEVRKAFNIKEAMPTVIGISPNQPSTMVKTSDIGAYWSLFFVLLFVLQVAHVMTAKNETAYNEVIEFSNQPSTFGSSYGGMDSTSPVSTAAGSANERVSKPFELKYGKTNVEFEFIAPVSNSWVEYGIELVNDDNGESIAFEQGLEYYWGRDSDGAWNEGSQKATTLLTSIPPGKYHFNIDASGEALRSGTLPTTIRIKRDVPIWSNFLWSTLFLSIFPLFVWWRNRSFEVNRWSQSDFSPYYTSDSGLEDYL